MSPPTTGAAGVEPDLRAFVLARLAEDEAAAQAMATRVRATATHRRAVLALHSPGTDGACPTCVDQPWPCLTLRHIAAAWADHPAYHPYWNP